jgi:hypothetical protein
MYRGGFRQPPSIDKLFSKPYFGVQAASPPGNLSIEVGHEASHLMRGVSRRTKTVCTPKAGFDINLSMGWVAARGPPKVGPDRRAYGHSGSMRTGSHSSGLSGPLPSWIFGSRVLRSTITSWFVLGPAKAHGGPLGALGGLAGALGGPPGPGQKVRKQYWLQSPLSGRDYGDTLWHAVLSWGDHSHP